MAGNCKNPNMLADGMTIRTVEMRNPIPIAVIKRLFMSAGLPSEKLSAKHYPFVRPGDPSGRPKRPSDRRVGRVRLRA